MELSLYPLLPPWLILAVLAVALPLTWWFYREGRASIGPGPRRVLMVLRMASFLVIALMLWCPGRVTVEKNRQKSHLVFLVDRSGSMATRDLELRQSRLQGAADFVQRQEFPELREYPREFYAFNQQTALLKSPSEARKLTATGGTDFRQAFARIEHDVGFGNVAGVILLSDGIDYSEFKGEEVTANIHSVIVGTDLYKVPDLGLGDVKCPARLSDREEISLDVSLLLTGEPQPREVTLSLRLDEQPPVVRTVRLTPGQTQRETVSFPPQAEGLHLVSLKVNQLPEEASYLNNERELVVEVVKAKDEIVVFFPVLTNSFRPLVREFERDPDKAFTGCYQVAPGNYQLRGVKLNQAFASGLPAPKDLHNITCLVLGASNGDLLSLAEAQTLESYVSEGGSLVLLGGADSFGDLPAGSALERLSPVTHLKDSGFVSGRFAVKTDAGTDNALTRKVNELIVANQAAPAEFVLTGLNRVRDVKSTAQVLLWADDGNQYPLLVSQNYGKGKVLALLTNSLHLWGSPALRDGNFGNFWRQLIAFARNLSEDTEILKIGLNQTELSVDETLRLTATVNLPDPAAHPDVNVTAELYTREGQQAVRSTTLKKLLDSYSAEFSGLPAGRYVLKVAAQDAREVLRERYKFILVGEIIRENIRLQVAREDFRKYSSDAHVYRLDEGARLEQDLLQVVRKNEVRREQFLIFETPAFFAVLLALLVAEWVVRRRYNLF